MPIENIYKSPTCEWLDVTAPTEEDLKFLHDRYEINKLLLDDTVVANHLPKFEQDGEVKFFLAREVSQEKKPGLNSTSDISTKLSIFMVGQSIITVHRADNYSTTTLRQKMRTPKISYSIDAIALDLALSVIKSFDVENNKLMDLFDQFENEIFTKNTNASQQIRKLYKLKRKAGLNVKLLNLSADWVNKMKNLSISEAEYTDLIDKYKDVANDFDHLNTQVSNLISMFLALKDQKANEVMKTLAMYSVYFLPITFIAGVYGMNFENMPELQQPHGYFATLGFMLLVVIITFIYFRKRKL